MLLLTHQKSLLGGRRSNKFYCPRHMASQQAGNSIHIKKVRPLLLFSFDLHLVPFWLVWVEIKFILFALPHQSQTRLHQFSKSKQHAVRAYCSNLYTVRLGHTTTMLIGRDPKCPRVRRKCRSKCNTKAIA